MRGIFSTLTELARFLDSGVWPRHHSRWWVSSKLLAKLARVALLAVHGFLRDKCVNQAAALTYNTLLSIVPILALLFGIAKGFGLDDRLKELLYQQMAGQQAVMEKAIGFAMVWLEDAKGGVVAGFGVLLMFYTASKVLGLVEASFNAIWQVPSRPFIRKFTDYVSIMLISPLFVILSGSLTVYITAQIEMMTDRLSILHTVSPLIWVTLKVLPFALMWVLFLLIYLVMPNTRVAFGSALVASLLAGSAFQLLQQGYISIMVMLSRYNVVYGSFAALPFFLIWMHLSWMIVLFGAQVAYNHHRVGRLTIFGTNPAHLSPGDQKKVALEIFKVIVHQFETGDPPLNVAGLAERTAWSVELVEAMAQKLTQAGLIAGVTASAGQGANGRGYLPALDIQNITLATFLSAWEGVGQVQLPDRGGSPWREPVGRALDELGQAVKASPANVPIKNI